MGRETCWGSKQTPDQGRKQDWSDVITSSQPSPMTGHKFPEVKGQMMERQEELQDTLIVSELVREQELFASGCEATMMRYGASNMRPKWPTSRARFTLRPQRAKIKNNTFTSNDGADVERAANYRRPGQEKPGVIAAETQGRVKMKQSAWRPEADGAATLLERIRY